MQMMMRLGSIAEGVEMSIYALIQKLNEKSHVGDLNFTIYNKFL